MSSDCLKPLVQRSSDNFTYDALGPLTQSSLFGAGVEYRYNGDGNLSSESPTGPSYVWDVSVAPAALLAAGPNRLVHGLGPLYMVGGDQTTTTLARDAIGSVRAELGPGGSVAAAFRFTAYGALAQNVGGPVSLLGYAGEFSRGGLLYLRARWYEPTVGRFITRDTYPGDASRASTLNLYTYAGGNPARFTDPTGHCLILCTILLGAAVGAITGGIGAALQGGTPQQVAIAIGQGALIGGVTGAMPGLALRPAIGALIGAGSDLLGQLIVSRDIRSVNWGSVAGSALGGAIASYGAAKTAAFFLPSLARETASALIGLPAAAVLPAIGAKAWEYALIWQQGGPLFNSSIESQVPGTGQNLVGALAK